MKPVKDLTGQTFNKLTILCRDTEKRDDPMNLITLCKPCHLAAHNHDTRGPVSPEIQKQLMEIIQSLYFSASFSQDTIVLLLQTH